MRSAEIKDIADRADAARAVESAGIKGNSKPFHVAIIGAGIAGLGAAYQLKRAADAGHNISYSVYESDARVGGQLWTDRPPLPCGGTAIADGGSDSYLSRKTASMSRVARYMGTEDELIGTDESKKQTFIVKGGKLVPLPDGIMMFAPTKILPMATTKLYSWPAKFRMALDIIMPRRKRAQGEDESIGSLVRRRLGNECYERLAEPLTGGINGSDPDTMSTLGTYPMLLEMEEKYGSLILGFLAQRKMVEEMKKKHPPRPGKPASTFFSSSKKGLDDYTNSMAKAIGEENIYLSTPVSAIKRNADGKYELTISDEANTEIIRYSGIQHDEAGNQIAEDTDVVRSGGYEGHPPRPRRTVDALSELPPAECVGVPPISSTTALTDEIAAKEMRGDSASSAATACLKDDACCCEDIAEHLLSPLQRKVRADAVVITSPAWTAGELLEDLAPEAAEILSNIPHSSCATIITAWNKDDADFDKNWHGILAPGIERQAVTGISLMSSKWAGRAPDNSILLRGFVGGARDDSTHNLPDEELIELCRKTYVDLLGLKPDAKPTYAKVFRFPRAMPQYIVGHNDRMDVLNNYMSQQVGLSLGGAAYTGVGVPNCMESGEAAARKVMQEVGIDYADPVEKRRGPGGPR
ncbi:MAG: protoporphyrinogen oxidase [Coriobacteriia bacterium]|nr:protoporphyrinogen oxidase [Coriobacteriia bacterium]